MQAKLLKRKDIIKSYNFLLDRFGIDRNDAVLSSGAACVMHGVRKETVDLDVDVTPDVFEMLRKVPSTINALTRMDDIDGQKHATIEWMGTYSFRVRPLPHRDTVEIDGVCVYTVDELLDQKMNFNRPKDQDDITCLKKILQL
jgi:hypothetical protein